MYNVTAQYIAVLVLIIKNCFYFRYTDLHYGGQGDSVENTSEENLRIIFPICIASWHQQGQAGNKTLFQQNPPDLNGRYQQTQVDLYNGYFVLL